MRGGARVRECSAGLIAILLASSLASCAAPRGRPAVESSTPTSRGAVAQSCGYLKRLGAVIQRFDEGDGRRTHEALAREIGDIADGLTVSADPPAIDAAPLLRRAATIVEDSPDFNESAEAVDALAEGIVLLDRACGGSLDAMAALVDPRVGVCDRAAALALFDEYVFEALGSLGSATQREGLGARYRALLHDLRVSALRRRSASASSTLQAKLDAVASAADALHELEPLSPAGWPPAERSAALSLVDAVMELCVPLDMRRGQLQVVASSTDVDV